MSRRITRLAQGARGGGQHGTFILTRCLSADGWQPRDAWSHPQLIVARRHRDILLCRLFDLDEDPQLTQVRSIHDFSVLAELQVSLAHREVGLSPDGRVIACHVVSHLSVEFRSMADGHLIARVDLDATTSSLPRQESVDALCWSNDGAFVLVGTSDTLRVLDAAKHKEVYRCAWGRPRGIIASDGGLFWVAGGRESGWVKLTRHGALLRVTEATTWRRPQDDTSTSLIERLRTQVLTRGIAASMSRAEVAIGVSALVEHHVDWNGFVVLLDLELDVLEAIPESYRQLGLNDVAVVWSDIIAALRQLEKSPEAPPIAWEEMEEVWRLRLHEAGFEGAEQARQNQVGHLLGGER